MVFILYLAKIVNSIAHFYANGHIFRVINGQNFRPIISPSGHTELLNKCEKETRKKGGKSLYEMHKFREKIETCCWQYFAFCYLEGRKEATICTAWMTFKKEAKL